MAPGRSAVPAIFCPLTFIKLNVILNKVKEMDGETMAVDVVPGWMANLEGEDVAFIKRFLLASGSLKEVARQYGVTYPTVRLRLDRLIQKIEAADEGESDPYVALVKQLALQDKLEFDTAKLLIRAYQETKKET